MTLKWDDVDFENKTVAIWTRKRYCGMLELDVMTMNKFLENVVLRRQKALCKDKKYFWHLNWHFQN